MRIVEVIGTVTLSRAHPALARARWIIGVPFSLKALVAGTGPDGEDLVIFDNLGAGFGHRIGISEGGEAAVPFFPERKPVDAYNACILDQIEIRPQKGIVMNKCPYCTAEIPDEAKKCMHCGEWVEKAEHPNPGNLRRPTVEGALNRLVDLGESGFETVKPYFKFTFILTIVGFVVFLIVFLILLFAVFLPMWNKVGGP